MIKPVPPRSSKMWMAIRALILLGLGERRYVPCDADFYDAIDCGELPKLDGWTKVADRLGEDHLVALIKGVVLAERASREYIDEQLRQSNLQEDLIENAVSMARQTQRENLLVADPLLKPSTSASVTINKRIFRIPHIAAILLRSVNSRYQWALYSAIGTPLILERGANGVTYHSPSSPEAGRGIELN